MRKMRLILQRASQFHNRLVKKWSVRKNITKREWCKLYWMELDRVQAGESSKVLFNGKLISNETKMREWERYSFASTDRPEGTL